MHQVRSGADSHGASKAAVGRNDGIGFAILPSGSQRAQDSAGDGAQRVDGDQRQIGGDVVVRRDRAEIESEPAEHEQQRTQAHHGNVVRMGGRDALAEEAGAD